jgi:hypothetical protein
MTLKPQMAADDSAHEDAADRSAAAAQPDLFVINLCSSTTPMALSQPDVPELKRFSFFVSRRLEDRRERFRLHMGYFESLEEAEEWLGAVRDVYPGAWAGEAPGKRLRARANATKQPAARSSAPSAPSAEAVSAVAALGLSPWTGPPPSITVPPTTVSAAVALAVSPPSQTNVTAPGDVAEAPRVPLALALTAPPVIPAQKVAAAAAAPATVTVARQVEKPKGVRLPPPDSALANPSPAAKSKDVAAGSTVRARPLAPLSNVREVLAALDERDTKHTAAAPRTAGGAQALSDTQVMRVLEERRSTERVPAASPDASGNIPMLRPEDTGTRRALQTAVRDNAAVSFAVQLQWSVEPMALDKVPPLAIFSAYTIYTVEGSREGRKWYGLRLGFFSDADAAKQVAYYVRSEFATVAVVPVSPLERSRATEAERKSEPVSARERPSATQSEEIKLLDEANAKSPPRVSVEPTRGAAKVPAGGARAASAAARAAATRSKKLRSKGLTAERKAPQSLEETLEILGAGGLEIDNGRGEFINETGVRHLAVEVRKNSPFARLVARLTERARKS